MKFVAISDMHNQYEKLELPKADVLIIAGDAGISGFFDGYRFVCWLEKQPFTHKIIIAGNHDGALVGDLVVNDIVDSGCAYLEDSGLEIEGIKIWGSPYTPTFRDWYFMADRGKEIKKHWDMIPEDTDVLITHGPPKGYLDRVTDQSEELGCEELRIAIDRIKPKYHIFGHIHGGYGKEEIKGTTFINCSVCNEAYKVVNEPKLFEFNKSNSPWDKEWDGLLDNVTAE